MYSFAHEKKKRKKSVIIACVTFNKGDNFRSPWQRKLRPWPGHRESRKRKVETLRDKCNKSAGLRLSYKDEKRKHLALSWIPQADNRNTLVVGACFCVLSFSEQAPRVEWRVLGFVTFSCCVSDTGYASRHDTTRSDKGFFRLNLLCYYRILVEESGG